MPNVATLPHTNDIAPYMAAADIIMGKAGPNILFESVMLGKPFFATTFIPGQEQENLAFIQRHGLGWVALHPEEQRSLLLEPHPQSRPTRSTIHHYQRLPRLEYTPINKSPTSFTNLSSS